MIAWDARISNINRMFVSTLSWPTKELTDDDRLVSVLDRKRQELITIVGHFLELLGLVKSTARGMAFTKTCTQTLQKLLTEAPSTLDDLNADAWALLIILRRMRDLSPSVPIPEVLLDHSMRFLSALIYRPKKARAHRRLKRQRSMDVPLPSLGWRLGDRSSSS
jgi:hypothetical protein